MTLQQTIGGVSIRLWVLMANLLGNILMVYGAVHYYARSTHVMEMVAGMAITGVCIGVLARPDRRP